MEHYFILEIFVTFLLTYNAGKINFLPYSPHFRSQPKDIAKRQCFGILIAAANLYSYDNTQDSGIC